MLSGLVTETSKKYIYQRMWKLNDLARESINGKKREVFMPKESDEKTGEEKTAEEGST